MTRLAGVLLFLSALAAPALAAAPGADEPGFLEKLSPILVLLVVVAVVVARLPRVEGVVHTDAYRRRRLMNWLPLGLTYMFLYMGRYNLTVAKSVFENMKDAAGGPLMSNAVFGQIFAIGTVVYGVSFVINGPLTDRYGGKKAIIAGAGGAFVANALMGLCTWMLLGGGEGAKFVGAHFFWIFALLYAANMYFQSFGAVAIVKCNAPWFHVRERGVFGAIFGILISLGIYFAFDVGAMIVAALPLHWVFIVPAIALALFLVVDVFMVANTPADAGLADIDTADASTDGPRLGAVVVFKMMMRNPIIVTIALVEFCSGFLRQAIMQWYRIFAKQTDATLHLKSDWVYDNWGMLLCCAGIMGGVFAGTISDHLFQSRRGPVAAVLYGAMLGGGIALTFAYTTPVVGWLVVFMSMCVIGVHGMLSGTASMDFGGKQNVGVAVGIIDGFVYLGTGFMSILYSVILPKQELDAAGKITGAATNPDNWIWWPVSMVPLALIGLVLAARLWHAKPKSGAAAAH
ncbi:MAG: MFS transporter [Myxococcales bacterium]|nr:MFS transporter [Myxococcales bacterium]